MNFAGAAERLSDVDLPRIGDLIGVGEDEIHAVLDVEATGSGFDSKSRPKMLFEPHIFYRELGPGSLRDRAVKEGLAYKSWRSGEYPRDSYPRLTQAMRISPEAALRACSWGIGQIMGFNHSLCGFATVHDMVRSFMESEGNQLTAMVRFIISAGLDDELRRHDWRGFARGYNGPSYASHDYHGRLERAFAKWSRIPDTPWKRSQATATAKSEPEPSVQDAGGSLAGVKAPSDPTSPGAPSGTAVSSPAGLRRHTILLIGGLLGAVATKLTTVACSIPVVSHIFNSCGG